MLVQHGSLCVLRVTLAHSVRSETDERDECGYCQAGSQVVEALGGVRNSCILHLTTNPLLWLDTFAKLARYGK
jgi:hypothetical protein